MDVDEIDAASPRHRESGFAAVDDIVDGFWARSPAPGLAYGVVRDGALVHWGGRGGLTVGGPAPNPDSVFRIASMTKSFTAAAVLILRDEGRLSLDDPVERYVPQLAGSRPTMDSPALTPRLLLTMSAGLPTDDPWADRQLAMSAADFDALLQEGLGYVRAPGTAYEYSDLSYAILGRLITEAAGEDYRHMVTSRLLRPLRMDATVFEASEAPPADIAVGYRRRDRGWLEEPFAGHGAFASMGGLFSTLHDLAIWIGEFTDAYPPRDDAEDGHALCRATRREMQQAQRAVTPARSVADRDGCLIPIASGYGFGLKIDHDPRLGTVVSHPGGLPGFGSAMRWHPASGIGVVVLANATYADATQVADRALQALLPATMTRRATHCETPLPAALAAQQAIMGLLNEWDDDVARRVFSDNVAMDEPLERRAAAVARARAQVGALHLDRAAGTEYLSPARLAWWMCGEHGRVRVEILLDPRSRPAVQALELTVVPEPSERVRRVVAAIADAVERPPSPLPPSLALAPGLDEESCERALTAAAALAGRCDFERPVAGDGATTVTYAAPAVSTDLELTVMVDPQSGALASVSLAPHQAQTGNPADPCV